VRAQPAAGLLDVLMEFAITDVASLIHYRNSLGMRAGVETDERVYIDHFRYTPDEPFFL
jgi:hypothetical protein